MNKLVLYHGNCADGFTAAWAAWLKFGDVGVEYKAVQYGPGQALPNVAGRDVLIVDFSYPRDVLLDLYERAASLVVLDHHKTAAAALEGLSFCTFDMQRSGAGITWDVLHAGEPRPPLISYVEDRDLWRWALPSSKEVNAYIGTHDYSFDAWDHVSHVVRHSFGHAVAAGGSVLRATARYVEQMAKEARLVEIAGHRVPCVNAPYIHVSELAGHLAEKHAFGVAWFQQGDGSYKYSLRSREGGIDVSEIAKRYGGGGHKASAGFTVDRRIDA